MRKRAFLPESPGNLEGRILLSGTPTIAHHAVGLSGLGFNLNNQMIRGYFEQ